MERNQMKRRGFIADGASTLLVVIPILVAGGFYKDIGSEVGRLCLCLMCITLLSARDQWRDRDIEQQKGTA